MLIKRIAVCGWIVASVLGALALSRGWADGVSETPLHYSGVLEEGGAPVDGARNIEVALWDDPSDTDSGHRVCVTRGDDVLVEAGRFRIALDSSCVAAVQSNPDLWVELRVGEESLGRTKVGAVPYAVESARASDASGALRDRIDTLAPPGTIVAFGGQRAPSGWLLCDGAEVSRAAYPALFAAIGTAHGAGDGATSFRLPDYRGRFLRGVASGSERDPDAAARLEASPGGNTGDAIGSVQDFATAGPRAGFTADSAGSHQHFLELVDTGTAGIHNGPPPFADRAYFWSASTTSEGAHTHPVSGGDAETRPANANVQFMIRY